MSRKTLRIDPAGWRTYADGETVTPQVHNAMVARVGALADILAKPSTHLGYEPPSGDTPARGVWRIPTVEVAGPMPSSPRERASLVGESVAKWLQEGQPLPAAITPASIPSSLTDEERARHAAIPADAKRYTWALVDVLRSMKDDSITDAALGRPRRAGEITLLSVVVVVGVVALAAVAIVAVQEAIRADTARRRDRLQVAQAANDFAERVGVFRATGVMPPPSEVELAAADTVRRRAAQAEGEGTTRDDWSTQLTRAAGGFAKMAYAAAILWVVFMVTKERT